MAEGKSIGELYLKLGLSLSELETDFIAADKTVMQNVARLNRQAELIKIRAQVEMEGLDKTADAEKILEIRQNALNEQLSIQRDRVRILNAECEELSRIQGENAVSTQRATIRVERERLALARLEHEVREVTTAISELNSTELNVSGTASISGGAGGAGGTGSSGGAGSSGGGGLTDLLPFELPTTKIEAFTMAVGALGAAVSATHDIIIDTLDDFRETEKQSYELDIDFNDAEQLLREMKLAGGEIDDVEGYIRGITDAYVKGEYDDPEFIALRKYGAQIVDETGRLKNFKDMLDEVYQAWQKADEAGEGIEFLQLTGGEAGVRDVLQYFRRLEEAREDAEKIVDANLDNEEWHELERSINLVNEQMDEFKEAIANIFLPAEKAAADSFFNAFKEGTEFLIENKDELQKWGYVASKILEELAPKFMELQTDSQLQTALKSFGEIYDKISGTELDLGDSKANEIFKKLQDDADKFYSDSLVSKAYKQFFGDLADTDLFKDNFIARAFEEAEKKIGDTTDALDKLEEKVADGNPLNQYAQTRINAFKDELEDLKIELEFGDNEYKKALAQLDIWEKREREYKNFVSEAEKSAIEEVKKARKELLDKQHNEEMQKFWDDAADIEYGLTHSAFEKQLRDIEQWQEAQKEKAATAEEVQGIIANAAAKEAEAFESAMDRIRGKLQSLDDKIFAQEHSQYENDLRRIQQERLRYYEDFRKEGVLNAANQAKIERWYQNAVGDLNQRAKNGGDYTKSPEGSMQRGGNGIVVIGADQIIDDGKIKQSIGLIADESQERALLMQGLSQEARDRVNAIQAVKQLNDAQKQLAQQASGFQLIEGDKIVNQPTSPQVIEGGNVVSDVQQFGNALEQSTDPVQSLRDSARDAADAQKSLADSVKNLPPEYFKTLADGTQAVSEMQMRLTDSTMHLIDAQNNLANALADLPTVNQSGDKNQSGGLMKLNYSTQALQDAQNRLSATTRDVDARLRDISDIPPQSQIAQNDSGWKFGIDYDTFKDVLLTGVGLAAPAAMTGVGTAAIPAIAAGTLGTAIAAAIAKGSYDETMAAHEQANRLNALPEDLVTPLGNIDTNVQSILQQLQDTQSNGSDRFQEFFGALPNVEASVQDILLELQSQAESESADYFTPINSIDSNLQSVLQTMQDTQTNEGDRFQEYFGALPNIEASVQDILLTLQARAEVPNTAETNPQLPAQSETGSIDYSALLSGIDSKIETLIQGITAQENVSFETVITPLNNIAGIVQNILSALENRQPPQITVAPNNNVDLGGAYVFDNTMKKSLVDDITSEIVNNITDAVRQATSTSSYGYGV